MSNTDCAAVRDALGCEADPEAPQMLGPHQQAHLASCLRCQAEQVQYRRLVRSLRSLRDFESDPGRYPGVDPEIFDRIDLHQRLRSQRGIPKAAAAAGGVVAGAAAAVGVIALASRHRRSLGLS